MSNFSQYFPIGGSSGGDGGGGINSYAPFKVTATDNPVGYNATTGLYTNPVDGSVFLKTGNTIIDTAGDYPDATIGPGNWSQTSADDFTIATNTDGVAYDGTFYYMITSGGVVNQYNTSFTATGVTWNASSDATGIVYEGGNFFVLEKSAKTVHKYNTSGVFQSSRVAGGNDVFAITALNGIICVLQRPGAAITASIAKVNPTTMAYLGSTTLAGHTSIIGSGGWFSDGVYLWTAQGSVVKAWDINGVDSGVSFSPSSSPRNGQIGHDGNVYSDSKSTTIRKFTPVAGSVGDSTARTSTMGDGQPLFIKLK